MAHSEDTALTADQALARLEQGNDRFLGATRADADVSPALRQRLFVEGQHPFACVITCSDSRVVPEAAFSCGLGDIFTIRTAGNVVGPAELASAAYAVAHLGVRLVVVLGHTGCGAVASALAGVQEQALAPILEPLAAAIGAEREPIAASIANVRAGVARLSEAPSLRPYLEQSAGPLRIVGALYHTDSGRIAFL